MEVEGRREGRKAVCDADADYRSLDGGMWWYLCESESRIYILIVDCCKSVWSGGGTRRQSSGSDLKGKGLLHTPWPRKGGVFMR